MLLFAEEIQAAGKKENYYIIFHLHHANNDIE